MTEALPIKKYSVSLTNVVHYILMIGLIALGLVSLFYRILGMRVYLFDLISIFFIAIFSIYFFRQKTIKRPMIREISPLICLISLMFLADTISIIGVLGNGDQDSLIQFSKAIVYKFVLSVFMISFLIFNALSDFKYSYSYLKILFIMVLLSSLYQFIFIFFALSLEVNLDEIIWPLLSFGSWVPMETSSRIGGGAVNFVFIRHGGFAGNPNLLIAQIICVVPIIAALAASTSLKSRTILLFIFTLSTLATLSRSGMAGLVIIFLLYPLFFKVRSSAYPKGLILFVSFASLLLGIDWYRDLGVIDGLYNLAVTRLQGESYFESSRYRLVQAGIDMWSAYPIFGVGLSSSPVLLEGYEIAQLTGASLHNYWLQIFVEKGIFAMVTVVYYLYIFYSGIRQGNRYGSALSLSLVCLFVLGFSNNALASPFIQVFLVVLYCAGSNNFSRQLV
jgi:hypothetical protein